MAGESCNLGKDEAEIFKPSSSPPSSAAQPSPPPSSPTPPPSSAHMKSCEESAILRPAKPDFLPASQITVADSSLPKHDANSSKAGEESETPVRFSKRCSTCQKKVGLTGFRCRCGDLFCGRHRYSDSHDCSFDYKAAGREEIAKANPVIRAAKIIKI